MRAPLTVPTNLSAPAAHDGTSVEVPISLRAHCDTFSRARPPRPGSSGSALVLLPNFPAGTTSFSAAGTGRLENQLFGNVWVYVQKRPHRARLRNGLSPKHLPHREPGEPRELPRIGILTWHQSHNSFQRGRAKAGIRIRDSTHLRHRAPIKSNKLRELLCRGSAGATAFSVALRHLQQCVIQNSVQ